MVGKGVSPDRGQEMKMSQFEIVIAGDRINNINEVGGGTVARVINSHKGWMAYRVVKTDRMSAMGPVYEVVGEGVKVSKLINLVDAADRIMAALEA